MTCDCDLNKKFGRIIRENDQVKVIVEYKDCTDEQRNISEMNVGEYCFDNAASLLLPLLLPAPLLLLPALPDRCGTGS